MTFAGVTGPLYLIDSSVWIRILRRSPPPALAARIDQLLRSGRVATNEFIAVEVVGGARNSADFEEYSELFASLNQCPIDSETWVLATRLAFDLRRAGATTRAPDVIIAASSIRHDAILVHADSGFDSIAIHSQLLVESYAAPVP
jgi:predicted nucleic acid-binding protein